MASKSSASVVLFLTLNLLLCNLSFSHFTNSSQQQYDDQCRWDLNSLHLEICADVLNGLVHAQIGETQRRECCSLIGHLVSLDAAVCVCTAIHANILDIVDLKLGVDLSILVNRQCRRYGYNFPSDVRC